MKAIVTGATGLIGRYLVWELWNKGYEVIAYCRSEKKARQLLPRHRACKIVCADLYRKDLNVSDEYRTADKLFHLAWDGVYVVHRDNEYLQEQNIKMTINVAKQFNVKTFVYAGSCGEYLGGSAYNLAKQDAGMFSKIICLNKGVSHIYTRVSNVYGALENPISTRCINSVVEELMNNKPLCINSRGLYPYNFIHGIDAARAFRLLGTHGICGGIYNVSGEPKMFITYMNMLRNIINPKQDILYASNKDPYYQDEHFSPVRLKKDTGWDSRISFEDGIKELVNWRKHSFYKHLYNLNCRMKEIADYIL